jgi:hypothetical protein
MGGFCHLNQNGFLAAVVKTARPFLRRTPESFAAMIPIQNEFARKSAD